MLMIVSCYLSNIKHDLEYIIVIISNMICRTVEMRRE